MIKTITKKQEAEIPKYIKKWIDLASEPIDQKKVKSIFKKVYGKDKTIIFGESFQNTIDLIRELTENKKLEYDSQLRSQLDSQLHSQLDSRLDSQLYSQLDSQLRSQLRSQLYLQLHSQLDSQLRSQLHSQLDSQLYSQLDSQDIKYSYYISYFLYDCAGYYDYAEKIGVEFDKKSLKQYFNILLNVPIIIFIGDVLFVCEKPKCYWNNQNLHRDSGPAISWKDGTGFYFLNAVRFEKELFEKVTSGNMPFEEILAIPDVDQRTQAMRFGDVDKFIELSKGEKLDEYTKLDMNGESINYALYKIPKGLIFTTDAYYMIYDCPSTQKKYMQGVIESKTVPEAMAWKISDEKNVVTPEDWKLMIPLVHES